MRKKFKSEDSIERQKILEKFEAVCAMFALDLIGVKVFGYSDETAEAVASGEKLLKESGTIYESFADMMSPDDAAKYLDFLANGSREGLTSAELAGVEKADTLLVSQKVGYEDVWNLRNPRDVLESGTSSELKVIGTYDNNNYFTRAVEFNAGSEGTGFTYKVYQRNDIDWNMVRTTGAKKGRGLFQKVDSIEYWKARGRDAMKGVQ